jgi:hypothetical protein
LTIIAFIFLQQITKNHNPPLTMKKITLMLAVLLTGIMADAGSA